MGAKATRSGKQFNRHVVMAPVAGVLGGVATLPSLVPFYPQGAPQALSGAGAMNVTSFKTNWTTTGAEAGTLADGTHIGQIKKIQLIVDGGDGTLTPSHLAQAGVVKSTITFADAGDFCVLIWDGAYWEVIDLGNDADGATAPVLA